MGPLIDVLLPTYEPDTGFLKAALASLQAQTEASWTCTIVDDASSIDGRTILAPYCSDHRFRFFRNRKRLGIGANWNAALARTHAPFVQYLFQDDLWHPEYLARASGILLQEPSIGFVASEHGYVFEEPLETSIGYHRLRCQKAMSLRPGRQNGSAFLRSWLAEGCATNLIGEPCFVMIRRQLLQDVGGFSERLSQLLDIECWVRLLRRSDWYYIPDNMGSFRIHRRSASFQHHEEGGHFSETMDFLECLRIVFPKESTEWRLLDQHLDQRFVDIIGHTVNRFLQGRSVGRGARPFLRHLATHPEMMLRGTCKYALQATERWFRKAQKVRFTSRQRRHADPSSVVAVVPPNSIQ